MGLPALYEIASPPPELGYGDAIAFRVRINPTNGGWLAFTTGGTDDTPDNAGKRAGALYLLGTAFTPDPDADAATNADGAAAHAALLEQARADIAACDAERAERRDKLGRALVELYGTTAIDGLDFSTPDAALATLEDDDFPNEIAYWLLSLPYDLKRKRADTVLSKLAGSWRNTNPYANI